MPMPMMRWMYERVQEGMHAARAFVSEEQGARGDLPSSAWKLVCLRWWYP